MKWPWQRSSGRQLPAYRQARVDAIRSAAGESIPPIWREQVLPNLSDKAVARMDLLTEMHVNGWLSHRAFTEQLFRVVAKDQKDDAVLARWWGDITGQSIAIADARERFRHVLKYANV